jgi:hypothetical protein
MKIIRNILFGVVYFVIYLFLAVMGTGGGHGNFYLLSPLSTWIFILIALALLTGIKSSLARVFFVVLMTAHYVITFFICLNVKEKIIKDWNRASGVETALVVGGFYLLGQLIIWLLFFKSIKNQKAEELD